MVLPSHQGTERSLSDVDTSLVMPGSSPGAPDEASLIAEAKRARPDLRVADLAVRSAEQALSAARLARLPYLTTNGSYGFRSKSTNENRTRYLGFPF